MCKDCPVYKKAKKNKGVCIWYMDNVIIGGKPVSMCPNLKKKEGK